MYVHMLVVKHLCLVTFEHKIQNIVGELQMSSLIYSNIVK